MKKRIVSVVLALSLVIFIGASSASYANSECDHEGHLISSRTYTTTSWSGCPHNPNGSCVETTVTTTEYYCTRCGEIIDVDVTSSSQHHGHGRGVR